MKLLTHFLIIISLTIVSTSFGQTVVQHRDTSKYYSFELNYWFNMHHFAWLESMLRTEIDSSQLTGKEHKKARVAVDQLVAYYVKGLVHEDLRTSDYMRDFKQWITGSPDLNNIPEQFIEHFEQLQKFDPIYQSEFWPGHKKVCLEVLNDNLELVRNTEEQFVEKHTEVTRQFWQEEKIKVDIVYVAKASKWNLRNRPYTSIFPTHVVMNAYGEAEVPGNWVELLYHESAHPLILPGYYFVGGTIADVATKLSIKPPRQLWHAYLFFFTGEISRELFSQQAVTYPEIYMERNSVFSNYLPALKKHLTPYINNKVTLAEATESILLELTD